MLKIQNFPKLRLYGFVLIIRIFENQFIMNCFLLYVSTFATVPMSSFCFLCSCWTCFCQYLFLILFTICEPLLWGHFDQTFFLLFYLQNFLQILVVRIILSLFKNMSSVAALTDASTRCLILISRFPISSHLREKGISRVRLQSWSLFSSFREN